MSRPYGVFISFEGSEGCGKTTQIQRLAARLEGRGENVLLTREPGGTPLGETIRHLLKYAPEGRDMAAETELLLFAASRAELVRKVIQPALEAGTFVIADRFLDSTTVYQGVARRLGFEAVRFINEFTVGDLRPDLTLLLDLDLAAAKARQLRRDAGTEDRMERLPAEFYEAVRDGYLTLARDEPERFRVIDAGRPVEAVEEEIWTHTQALLGK